MFYDVEEVSLKALFKGIISENADVVLLSYKGEVLKCNFEKFPIWCLWQTGECIDSLEFASKLVERKVKRNECFYVLRVLNGNLMGDYIVPQKELSEYLRYSRIIKQFKNIDKVYFEPLKIYLNSPIYHGTRKKQVKKIKDLDPNKCNEFGDFGKGVYFTNIFEIARQFSLSDLGKRTKYSSVFLVKWENDSLETVFKNFSCMLKDNNCDYYFDELVANNGDKYRVKIYTKYSDAWLSALWDGWLECKQQADCDLVIGPMSFKDTANLRITCLDLLAKGVSKQKCHEYFNKKVKLGFYNNEPIYQICVYNNDVITHFS